MHTLSPEVEPPPGSRGTLLFTTPAGPVSPAAPAFLLQNLLQVVRTPLCTTCVSVLPEGERAGTLDSRRGGRSCPEVWPRVPASQALGTLWMGSQNWNV